MSLGEVRRRLRPLIGDPDDPLLAFDNVVMTPHIAVASRVNGALDMEELVTNIERALAGA